MKVKEFIEKLSTLNQEFKINYTCCDFGVCENIFIYKLSNANEYVLRHEEAYSKTDKENLEGVK